MSDPQVRITARRDGPFRVEIAEGATVEFVDHDGTPIPIPGPRFSLCRCGESLKKPFCDGTHKTNGFVGTCEVSPAARDVPEGGTG